MKSEKYKKKSHTIVRLFFLVTRTRIDRLLRILMARRPNALRSVPASPLSAKNDSPNRFINGASFLEVRIFPL